MFPVLSPFSPVTSSLHNWKPISLIPLHPFYPSATALNLGILSASPGRLVKPNKPTVRISDSVIANWGGASEFAFLTSSQEMLLLLIQGPHLENLWATVSARSISCSSRFCARFWLAWGSSCQSESSLRLLRELEWAYKGKQSKVSWLFLDSKDVSSGSLKRKGTFLIDPLHSFFPQLVFLRGTQMFLRHCPV